MHMIKNKQFDVRLARSKEEIEAAQSLRYEVFIQEFGAKTSSRNHDNLRDEDKFDRNCDHLLLIDQNLDPSGPNYTVVGTVRLIEAHIAMQNEGFYTSEEFNLSKILQMKKKCLEIGRACIKKKYRGSVALHLLWSGLAEYVVSRNITIMFGVASFHGTDVSKFSSALSYLNYNFSVPRELEFTVNPQSSCEMNIIPKEKLSVRNAMFEMPSLIRAYLRLGAKVGHGAFIDSIFNTIDIGIFIDTDFMNNRYKDFYGRTRGR